MCNFLFKNIIPSCLSTADTFEPCKYLQWNKLSFSFFFFFLLLIYFAYLYCMGVPQRGEPIVPK